MRDVERAAADAHFAWLKIAEGAALATETTHKVTLNTGVHEYLFNRPLQEAMQKNLGGPAHAAEALEAARADFARRTAGRLRRSPIPSGPKPPLP